MSLRSTRDALQALHATIPGVKSAPTTYPGEIRPVMLPLVLTIPGAATWQQVTIGDLRRQDRQYKVQVFIAPVTQASGLELLPELLQAFGETYLATDVLDAPGYQATLTGDEGQITDTGLVELTYAGQTYIGFEVTVHVYEKW